jgi:hypothetical protein
MGPAPQHAVTYHPQVRDAHGVDRHGLGFERGRLHQRQGGRQGPHGGL